MSCPIRDDQPGAPKTRLFLQLSGSPAGPDGMAIDEEDNLVVVHAGFGTVWVFSALGEPLYRIRSCAGMRTTNVTYGDVDRRSLFITEAEHGVILRARLPVAGKTMFGLHEGDVMRLSVERVTFLTGFCCSLLFLWQSAGLDTWSIIGPGPGLFPLLTTAFCCVVAGLLFLFPGLARNHTDTERAADPPLEPAERRTFLIYCAAMPLLVVASTYLGFFSPASFWCWS